MVRRYGKRYSKRRSSRRSVLNTTRVLTRKSATSQAKQILALRRKVNRVYRATKPEIKLLQSTPLSSTFSNSPILSNTFYTVYLKPLQGTTDGQRVGDRIKILSGTLYLSLEYQIVTNANSEEPSFHLGEASGCQVRVIFLQPKQCLQEIDVFNIDPSKILEYGGGTGNSYSMRTVSPFAQNITERFTVLADRKFIVSVNRPIVEGRIKMPGRTARFTDDNLSTMPFCMIITSGLHSDANFSDQVIASYAVKYPFTDA